MRKRIPGTRIPIVFLENTSITEFLKCYPHLKGRKEELTFIKSLLKEERERIREEVVKASHRDGYDVDVVFLDDLLSIIGKK